MVGALRRVLRAYARRNKKGQRKAPFSMPRFNAPCLKAPRFNAPCFNAPFFCTCAYTRNPFQSPLSKPLRVKPPISHPSKAPFHARMPQQHTMKPPFYTPSTPPEQNPGQRVWKAKRGLLGTETRTFPRCGGAVGHHAPLPAGHVTALLQSRARSPTVTCHTSYSDCALSPTVTCHICTRSYHVSYPSRRNAGADLVYDATRKTKCSGCLQYYWRRSSLQTTTPKTCPVLFSAALLYQALYQKKEESTAVTCGSLGCYGWLCTARAMLLRLAIQLRALAPGTTARALCCKTVSGTHALVPVGCCCTVES
eukprot:2819613-Rhodomonas_salina.3